MAGIQNVETIGMERFGNRMNGMLGNSVNKCIIITGMSGGGKSSALDVLEDEGFFSIDNLPPSLLPQLITILGKHSAAVSKGIAAVVDVRSEELLRELESVINSLKNSVQSIQLLFFDASDTALLKRFGATRRRHPLAGEFSTLEGIAHERDILESIKNKADIIIDSSGLTGNELRAVLLRSLQIVPDTLTMLLSSFGFKYGVPMDADYIFDVRFLPNPNYIPELHFLSGCDQPVQDYLSSVLATSEYIKGVQHLFDVILPLYSNTGKKKVHIATGCTGGRHRSVALTEKMTRIFEAQGRIVTVSHRDIHKEFQD